MQVKLLHALVEEMAGLDTGRIVDILFGKKDVNEFLIARKMELTINQIRNILYKLSAEGLVSFIRKKDKRKGWYIYYWTLKTEKCLVKLEQSLMKKIKGLNEVLNSREIKRFANRVELKLARRKRWNMNLPVKNVQRFMNCRITADRSEIQRRRLPGPKKSWS